MGFAIFDTVSTVYGPGFVAAVREDCYVVKLGNWQLAQGQSPTLYLQEDAMKRICGAFPGAMVSTGYGPARVQSIRGDGMHIAKPINWKLANNTIATFYLNADAVNLTFTAGLNEGDEVMTVYGQGYIERVRESDVVVKLRNWALAQGQSPTLYVSPSTCIKVPGIRVGTAVKTVWGMVRVLAIHRDGKHVCEALHWNLANQKPPTLYLAPEAFALLSLKPQAEKSV
mmetsp:Transcript_5643/g.5843  ORF Transcript_5643/g.5843 Transcript_5643/m.5843 type:complete len:227 (-) Transcript_5643:43-723(-)